MAKTKQQKQEILNDLKQKLKESKSVIFINFEALTVKENEELRDKLREENGEYYVAKKTLLDLALKEAKQEVLNPKELEGKIATIFSYKDAVTAAKVVDNFRKEHEDKISFSAGILEDKALSTEEVINLAQIPSRQELYAKLVGSINAPVSGFVNALAGNMRNLVYALSAIKESKS